MLTDLIKLQLDIMGARGELALSMLGSGWLERVSPKAKARTGVFAMPGFLASGKTLLRLTQFLNRLGYEAETWGLGRNLGPRGKDWSRFLDELETRLGDRIEALADKTSAPVVLIGQSLGGVYARELAARFEPMVDRVITLGSPTFHPYRNVRHNRVISSLSEWMSRKSAAELGGREGLLHLDPDKPAMPFVAIHSPLDGVVDERSCYIPEYIVTGAGKKSPRENIRVMSTHIGMNTSPWVWLAIADRLAHSREDWEFFQPGKYLPGPLRALAPLIYPAQSQVQNPGRRSVQENRSVRFG